VSDEELLAWFKAGTLAERGLPHRDHVRLAWLHLRRYPVLEVLARLSAGLRTLALACGKPDAYHETITWAYVFLIRERMAQAGPEQTWQEFAEAHPDLFAGPVGALRTYYREETLHSELARKGFVLPAGPPPLHG
jgi:hypothetical protein